MGSSKRWQLLPPAPPGVVNYPDLPLPIAHTLYHRGLTDRPDIDAFLKPTAASLHDPCLLPGMPAALDRLEQVVRAGETVGILGDFDVDGVSGTALLALALGQLGCTVVPYLPHRVEEGHGPNPRAIARLGEQGCTLMITVDCGVTSPREVDLAHQKGMDVVITDHHTPRPPYPKACAVIDPKLPDNQYPFHGLSGAGLAFKLAQALYQRMGQPWPAELLALAAIGTIADISPLVNENRFLVKAGLECLSSTRHPGFQALYQQARFNAKAVNVEDVSFIIAPRLNAAGRLDHAITAYRLLTAQSEAEAQVEAQRLEQLNQERRRITDEALQAAREELTAQSSMPFLLMVGRDWYVPGIVGLVASQLVEEFRRPAVVMCLGAEEVRASARSIPEFNMVEALATCHDLFTRYGGHPQAAGFTMPRHNLPELRERLQAIAAEHLEGRDLEPTLAIDAELPASQLAGPVFQWSRWLAPYGQENPAPVFLTRNLQPVEVRRMGEQGQHLRLKLKENRAVFDALAFRQGNGWDDDLTALDVVYTLRAETRGSFEVVTLSVLDFRPSGE